MSSLQLRTAALAVAFALIGGAAHAQDQSADQKRVAFSPIPIKVTVTISRSQGDKKISTLPYVFSLWNTGNGSNASLRMGNRVPITTTTLQKDGQNVPTVNYEDIGTNVDVVSFTNGPNDDGSVFRLSISIEESSVFDDPKGVTQVGRPTFRSFRSRGVVAVKDGQTTQLSNTTDRLTGETVRVDVAVAVVK